MNPISGACTGILVKGGTDNIEANSSAQFAEITWDIAGQVDKHFQVALSLVDGQGHEISSNQYLLLIGDQQEATERMQQMKQQQAESTSTFTYGNYYRFYPAMAGENDRDWQGHQQIPRARGFGAVGDQ